MDSKICEWNSTGYTHFAYARPSYQPDIKYDEDGNHICPYCGKIISFEEDECDEF